MGLAHSPSIVMNGLVLALDAGNSKSFDDDENLLTYSEQFNDAAWAGSQANVTFTANSTTAPDGTNTADLVSNTGQVTSLIGALVTVSASSQADYYVTVYAKKATSSTFTFNCYYVGNAEDNVTFNFDTGVVSGVPNAGEYIFQNVGNGWYRCGFRMTKDSTGTRTQIIFRFWESGRGNTSGNTYFWGAQLEKSSVANPYYATTGTAKNRGTTWTDLSGKGITGAFGGSTSYSSANGGALVFNGGTDNVFASGIVSGEQYTWSAWVNSSSVSTEQNILSMNGPYFMRITNSTVRFNILTSGGWLFQQGTTTLSNNTWYYLTMVFDSVNSLWKGYINGVQEFSVTKTGTHGYSSFYVYIGYTPQGGENAPFNGKIASIQYYNRALTAAEIQQNFNALRGRFGI